MALSPAERQRRRREKLRSENKKLVLVKGQDGFFDERFRIALAVRELALSKRLPEEIIELIIETSGDVFPCTNAIDKKYIEKLLRIYLNN